MNQDLSVLVSEYQYLGELSKQTNWELIEAKLADEHDWTEDGAQIVVALAKKFGFSILRNAAALAYACNAEDGELCM